MKKNLNIRNSTAEFLIFTSQNEQDSIEVKVHDKNIWLTQKLIAELFDKSRNTITEHLKNIFKDEELDENSVCREFRHTENDGKNYNTKYYNLDAIISVGYRVNSKKATQFRQWATRVLKEFAIKGFVLDKKKFYQKITDIYVTSVDYSKDDKQTNELVAKSDHLQNLKFSSTLPYIFTEQGVAMFDTNVFELLSKREG